MNEKENISKKSDEVILALSCENPSLFSEIVIRYEGKLYRAAYSIVRNKEEAEDIVQESLTKIYLHAGKFQKQEGASFSSWAYRITVNCAISHYRKLKRKWERESLYEPEIYENLPDNSDIERDLDTETTVSGLLEKLPLDLRRIVKLYYIEDKSYKVIADEEGIPLSTLKMRLFRAKKLLKNIAYDAL